MPKITELLYVRAKFPKTTPIDDELSAKFEVQFNLKQELGSAYRGRYTCSCGATSTCHDYLMKLGNQSYQVNSLALHYLREHREEVSAKELALLANAFEINLDAVQVLASTEDEKDRFKMSRANALRKVMVETFDGLMQAGNTAHNERMKTVVFNHYLSRAQEVGLTKESVFPD